MADKINIVLLAAGKGTRLNLKVPKPLCPFMGKTLVDFVLREIFNFCEHEKIEAEVDLIVGHQKELLTEHIETLYKDKKIGLIHQKEQLGTGHAVQVYFENKKNVEGQALTFIMCADTPLLKASIFREMYEQMKASSVNGVAATFMTDDPTGYGRIVRQNSGFSIVEEKDADSTVKKINEVNSGLYLVSTQHIKDNIFNLTSENKANEFYLTDLFKPEYKVVPHLFEESVSFEGINSLLDLELVERHARERKLAELRLNGVRFIDSQNIYLDDDVQIGRGTVIYPGVHIEGKTSIGEDCIIESHCVLKNSIVANSVKILAGSYFEQAEVRSGCAIGPYARLRPGTVVGEECKIGNFVETKKAILEREVKVSHLSYVGDAEVGEGTNIGCGFITCNYDGKDKHLTKIGKDSFIGSDCQMIAPVTLGERVYIGSGSTINKDVPDDSFAIARERQVTKPGMAKKFLKKK